MAEQEQNRTEQASPFKLSEAKKRGQVAKSLEFNTLVMVTSLLLAASVVGKATWESLGAMSVQLLSSAATVEIDARNGPTIFSDLSWQVIDLVLPYAVTGVVAAIIANLVQTGPILSADPIKPKFERLNPVAGFKRVFNKRMLFETFKSLVKLVFFGMIAYAFFRAILPGLGAMAEYGADGEARWLGVSALSLLFRLVLGLLVVGIIDIAFTRRRFNQQMMMSKREVKEEVKRREGDPQIRAKIKELQRENLKQARSMGKLPNADVLITNPTHYAVALHYDRSTMNAPIVLAKGADHWAAEMRTIARRHGIPVLERKQLARLLFKRGALEQAVPLEAFVEVAKVYADLARERRNEARIEMELAK